MALLLKEKVEKKGYLVYVYNVLRQLREFESERKH